MEVGVEIRAENIVSGEVRHIGNSYVIYVALDENGKPTPVPPLVPTDDQEKEIIERAYNRRMKRRKIEKELTKE
jgi:acyl-CoA hydrolase